MLETLNQFPGVVPASIEGVDTDGQPLISWEGSPSPQPAYAVAWMGQPIDWSACRGLRAIIAFESSDDSRPVILGLLDAPPPVELVSVPIEVEPAPAEDELVTSEDQAENPEVLNIESEKELILQCGKAKIALRADGRVMIMGGYVLSRSTGVNKIKGGSVHIN
jgi:hypothetical protein